MTSISRFGQTSGGEPVEKITLRAGDLQVAILTLGAVVQSVRLAGVAHDLTLGSDRVADYEGARCHDGSIIAPVVNRLTKARAPLGADLLQFEVNFNRRHVLHSGRAGTQFKVWHLAEATDSMARLVLDLPDGEGGFPGNRHVEALYEMHAPATLRLTVTVTSDAETLWNSANHSYWNLDGSADFTGHRLRVAADAYLPNTEDFIPTGEIRPVAGMFDFRKDRPISPQQPDLDNCFCLGREQTNLRDVLWLTGASGTAMVVATTEPGVQVYDCRHDGYKGVAIEAQGWPDAPNRPDFPAITLAAQETRAQITEWRFQRG